MEKKKWVVAEKISEDIVSQLLYNRGLRDKNAIANFFNPPTPEVIVAQYPCYINKINTSQVEKAVGLIKEAVSAGRPIIVHGDYDVDGICGTAILYQTLKNLGANVTPFIPDRFDEGYGLSINSIKKIQQTISNQQSTINNSPLLITTDCGIGAVDEVKYAKSLGFDVIITDHHAKGENLPEADAIVWTDELAGAGVAYLLASRLVRSAIVYSYKRSHTGIYDSQNGSELLDLVALATIADVQPLTGVNRALVKHGLVDLNARPGLGVRELIRVSGLEGKEIGPYEVGWMLAPRLNASGRLENAMDSFRLLVTNDPIEAQNLAAQLNRINQERQQLTQQTVEEAKAEVSQIESIIVLQKETWHEGIVGLVAGKLKEEFYRPAVIIAGGEKIVKGSARSISGFNIVEALRQCQDLLVDVGGHEMAAGFSIELGKVSQFREKLAAVAAERLTAGALSPVLKIDTEAALTDLNWKLIENLKKFEPFGVGNPKPTFLTKSVRILNIRTVGNNGKHLKIQIRDVDDVTMQPCNHFPVIGFGFGEWANQLRVGGLVDIVYNLEENHWNGQTILQLKLKDLRKSNK